MSVIFNGKRRLIIFKQVQKISNTEVPTEFHAKDAQFLAEQEFMEVIINCPVYFSSPVLMQHAYVDFRPLYLLSLRLRSR